MIVSQTEGPYKSGLEKPSSDLLSKGMTVERPQINNFLISSSDSMIYSTLQPVRDKIKISSRSVNFR